jgi:ATP-dependent DNA helicase RecG
MHIDELQRRLNIGEDEDTEFKSAEGGLPKSLWETLSAFANTSGGYIIFGIAEKGDNVEIHGIRKPDALIKNFWDAHNNPQKFSVPVCSETDVRRVPIDNRTIIVVHVPQVSRTQRPVYINGNPMSGTYKRNFEGDYHCTEAEVRQMLRDAGDEPQDLQILDGFGLKDLDEETIKAFRQRFGSREPDHPFLALDDRQLLISLGGWHRNRLTGKEGLTLAGLLMFGRERSLLDAMPYFHVDYQEQLSSDPDQRWTYRLSVDGKWEPNLFNFYYRTYSRLVTDLDIPFQLNGEAVRKGETHVHEALREALVNTLIHADHISSRPIIVIKRPDVFLFQNPGRLRIPLQRLYDGGVSDPRNPNLQKMFQMLGLGEKAGSGFQKILRAWREQEWIMPLVSEKLDLDVTAVALPMISMIPAQVEKELKGLVGDAYPSLTELDRITLVLAHRFGDISNSDIRHYRKDHPREIGDRLKFLVERGWLMKTGHGRGSRYRLSRGEPTRDLFSVSSEHSVQSSEHYSEASEHYSELVSIASPVRDKGRAPKSLVRQIILKICADDYVQLRTLADLLKREVNSIRNHYVNPMVAEGLLELRYPFQPNHPSQAYKTVDSNHAKES